MVVIDKVISYNSGCTYNLHAETCKTGGVAKDTIINYITATEATRVIQQFGNENKS